MLALWRDVFVGTLSGMVRDKLWDKIAHKLKDGGAIDLHTANNEQGFAIRTWGSTRRHIEDFDGLFLVSRPSKAH